MTSEVLINVFSDDGLYLLFVFCLGVYFVPFLLGSFSTLLISLLYKITSK